MIEKPNFGSKSEFTHDDTKHVAEALRTRIAREGRVFTERVGINANGRLQNDPLPSLLASLGYESVENFLALAQKLTEEYPEFEFSFKQDPARQWIEYSVGFKN